MTDKEKIELIIQEKHLNNTQFCSEVCIAPGTLSHIRSGRTEPTLNILRSIAQAFPDINPAWLFYGEGSMYKNVDSPAADRDAADVSDVHRAVEEDGEGMPDLFGASKQQGGSAKSSMAATVAPAVRDTAMSRSASAAVPGASMSVQEIVAETLRQQQKPQRKVVEVRIFFDDGTFETFSAN